MNGEPRRPRRLRGRWAPPPPPPLANGSGRTGGVVVTCGPGVVAAAPPPGAARGLLRRLPRPPAPPRGPCRRSGTAKFSSSATAPWLVEGKFVECYEPTVESTYNKVVVVGKDEFQLQLVDTAGQDEYTILPHSFVIGIHGYVLVYSVTSLQSFQVVQTLHTKLYKSRGKTRMPVVLVGNKADLALQSWEVRTDEGKKLAESWGAIFLESSAKESQVTVGIFMKLIEEIDRVDDSYGKSNSCHLM